MMAFDVQNQEQIDSTRTFWQQWGRLIVTLFVVFIMAYLGFKGDSYLQYQQAQKAAVAYEQIEMAAVANDIAQLEVAVKRLQQDFVSSAYATRGSLILARAAFEKGDLLMARSALEWVLGHSKEESVKAVARLRLASLLLDQKNYTAAIAELERARPVGFDALFVDLKGDVLVAKGDPASARDAYKSALSKFPSDSLQHQFTQMKLDALGA